MTSIIKATTPCTEVGPDPPTPAQPLISYGSCRRRLMPIEASSMDNSPVLLFVIDSGSRALSSLIEAAYHIGLGRTCVLLCVQRIQQDGAMEDGEVLAKQALKDYNRGSSYLSALPTGRGCPSLKTSEKRSTVSFRSARAAADSPTMYLSSQALSQTRLPRHGRTA